MPKAEEIVGDVVVGTLRNMDVGYMITDLKKIFGSEEEFETFSEVLKESLGEFLADVYTSNEEHVTLETLFLRLKAILNRRIDEA